jgi:hypothetical protein
MNLQTAAGPQVVQTAGTAGVSRAVAFTCLVLMALAVAPEPVAAQYSAGNPDSCEQRLTLDSNGDGFATCTFVCRDGQTLHMYAAVELNYESHYRILDGRISCGGASASCYGQYVRYYGGYHGQKCEAASSQEAQVEQPLLPTGFCIQTCAEPAPSMNAGGAGLSLPAVPIGGCVGDCSPPGGVEGGCQAWVDDDYGATRAHGTFNLFCWVE